MVTPQEVLARLLAENEARYERLEEFASRMYVFEDYRDNDGNLHKYDPATARSAKEEFLLVATEYFTEAQVAAFRELEPDTISLLITEYDNGLEDELIVHLKSLVRKSENNTGNGQADSSAGEQQD